ncbi:MAG: hypothetical protein BAA01_13630 [Bacillus thermozeamaize]|uniref:histidine kinase n=1 Tax=Bacillus thermozeamaize TaxID=230954 RepID=A0A1Y3PKX8_9BACI|nr:MAG: hypothetical protein BAA01_13630 [Bacillus thermozeamaize]
MHVHLSIRWRLTLWYCAILIPALLLLGSFVYLLVARTLALELDNHLNTTAQEVEKTIRVVSSFPFPWENLVLPDVNVFADPDTFLQVVDFSRNVIVSKSRNLGNQTLPVRASTIQRAAAGERFYQTLTVDGQSIRLYNVPLKLDGQLVGLLQVGSPLSGMKRSLQNLRWALFAGGLIMLGLTGAVGWWMAHQALRPIEQIAQTAAEIQEGKDLARRIAVPPIRDELGQLAETLNSMLERLEQAYRSLAESHHFQRRFISDVSHELRTPLTTIKGNLDLLYRLRAGKEQTDGDAAGHQTAAERGLKLDPDDELEMLNDARTEVDRMIRLIQDLLTLAQADTGVGFELKRVKVADWLPQSLRLAERLPRSAAVTYQTEIDPALLERTHLADTDALQQLVYILVENAFKYTPQGKVTVTASAAGEMLQLLVEDTGIGMPPEVQKHIFERFYRADPARSTPGTGLGLSIAERIVAAHRGKIEVNSREGEGSCFRVLLPLQTAENCLPVLMESDMMGKRGGMANERD